MDSRPPLPVRSKLLHADHLAVQLVAATVARPVSAPSSPLSRRRAMRRPKNDPVLPILLPSDPPALEPQTRIDIKLALTGQQPPSATSGSLHPAPRKQSPKITYHPSRETSGEDAEPADAVEAVYSRPQKSCADYEKATSQNLRLGRTTEGATSG